jgi:hypothetical protein
MESVASRNKRAALSRLRPKSTAKIARNAAPPNKISAGESESSIAAEYIVKLPRQQASLLVHMEDAPTWLIELSAIWQHYRIAAL